MCDTTKSGFIETSKIASILNTIGQVFDDEELQEIIEEVDVEGQLLLSVQVNINLPVSPFLSQPNLTIQNKINLRSTRIFDIFLCNSCLFMWTAWSRNLLVMNPIQRFLFQNNVGDLSVGWSLEDREETWFLSNLLWSFSVARANPFNWTS